MKNSRAYERPELMKLGKAEEVTLGAGGVNPDNCGCVFPNSPPPVDQLGS